MLAMEIEKSLKQGSAELAVLSVLETTALHGYEIAKRIEQQSDGALRFDVASLYPLLYRLERDGLLSAYWEDAKSGRRRRYYRITAAGKKRLVPLRKQWKEFFNTLNRLARFQDA